LIKTGLKKSPRDISKITGEENAFMLVS